MSKCPDCDSVRILSFPQIGDGKCSVCHGSGKDCWPDIIPGQDHTCTNCGGSGICPTCGGEGEIDE